MGLCIWEVWGFGSLGISVLWWAVHEAIHICEQHQQVCIELLGQLLCQAVIVLEPAQLVLQSRSV